MAVMFFAKIDVIVCFKHEQFVSCLREAVCYTYVWGIKLPSSENAFIWGLIVSFVIWFWIVLTFYKMNKHFLGRECASYKAMTGNTQSSYLLGHQG